jgi:signal transduction histidine kinase
MDTLSPDLSEKGERNLLLAYIVDLEAEVDRLRNRTILTEQTMRDAVGRAREKGVNHRDSDVSGAGDLSDEVFNEVVALLNRLDDMPDRPVVHDKVTPILLRPLIEQIFSWQKRVIRAPMVTLRLTLQVETADWFPERLRHILDRLISNAMRFRDGDKGEMRIGVDVRLKAAAYEIRVSDNGVGISPERRRDMLEIAHRVAPSRKAGLGVGLAVIKLLAEQSGGSLTVESVDGQGSLFNATLPRYEIGDFLESA